MTKCYCVSCELAFTWFHIRKCWQSFTILRCLCRQIWGGRHRPQTSHDDINLLWFSAHIIFLWGGHVFLNVYSDTVMKGIKDSVVSIDEQPSYHTLLVHANYIIMWAKRIFHHVWFFKSSHVYWSNKFQAKFRSQILYSRCFTSVWFFWPLRSIK